MDWEFESAKWCRSGMEFFVYPANANDIGAAAPPRKDKATRRRDDKLGRNCVANYAKYYNMYFFFFFNL